LLFIMQLCGSMSWNGMCMQHTRHSMTCCHTTV